MPLLLLSIGMEILVTEAIHPSTQLPAAYRSSAGSTLPLHSQALSELHGFVVDEYDGDPRTRNVKSAIVDEINVKHECCGVLHHGSFSTNVKWKKADTFVIPSSCCKLKSKEDFLKRRTYNLQDPTCPAHPTADNSNALKNCESSGLASQGGLLLLTTYLIYLNLAIAFLLVSHCVFGVVYVSKVKAASRARRNSTELPPIEDLHGTPPSPSHNRLNSYQLYPVPGLHPVVYEFQSPVLSSAGTRLHPDSSTNLPLRATYMLDLEEEKEGEEKEEEENTVKK
ncbi:uncharacterized protein LOC101849961 [Aplysia californica]|uniref:Uncharacterized protein LOC101849961 n=1 Tax=Aplysia californica TaxID=6500 RepID=A0ABM1A9E8_APLCA|nr:uncharacterized protein LOC101849961 [Aplysia californica]